jgi:hypothetical protein
MEPATISKPEHAIIKFGGFSIPLIGIPKDAALEDCDCCGDAFYIGDVEWNGRQYLCKKCKG